MSQPCKEQDKIRGKFIRAYYSNSAGGGLYKESLTEAAARAKAAEMRKKGYQFGESELPAKYSCWWGDPAFQHITIEYEAYCKIELTSELNALEQELFPSKTKEKSTISWVIMML